LLAITNTFLAIFNTAARLAESSGYRLALETNHDGEVCFVLSAAAA
jgi:hypothetical protein